MRRLLLVISCSLILLGGSTPVQAGHFDALGRYFGLGWGDGYHAHEGHQLTATQWEVSTPTPARVYNAPAPGRSEVRPTPASSRRQAPTLPSQRMSQRPVYWYK
ncbi:MAG TPA: hypothetical protein VL096_02680 [Pirellulaceae bacterium]|nr:hypothetical protein [Pirellulaceae bacterium]